jgi:hypothetical protein
MDTQQGKAARSRQPKLVRTEASPTGISQQNTRVNRTNLRTTGITI